MSALRPVVEGLSVSRRATAALSDDLVALDWEELDRRLGSAVAALRSLDTQPAGRVAVMAHNSVETVLAHAAVMLAGLSPVPISFHLTADEVVYVLDVSQARLVLVGPETARVAQRAAARASRSVRVLGWRLDRAHPLQGRESVESVESVESALPVEPVEPVEPGGSVESWEQLVAAAASDDDSLTVRPRPPLMFTSGTTGRPKPVEQPPNTFPAASTVAELLSRFRDNPLARFSPHLVVGPLYHTGPLTAVRLLLAGTSVVVLPRFDAEALLRSVQEHRVAASVMVPTHFSRLLALPSEVRNAYDLASLQRVVHTGAACPVEVKRRMIDWWGPILEEAYGGTEVGTTNSIDTAEWLSHPGSVGKAVSPFEVLVLDESGREVPAGTPGRLCFRDSTGRGLVYAIEGLDSDSGLGPGVFTLGEIGYVDKEGYVYITDRSADLVVSGGVNVYPAEAERVLASHPGVEDVAAFGVPHPEMGEELQALIVLNDPRVQPAQLLAYCRSQLAGFKCPRSVQIVDQLPRTAMGKLDKRVLRERYGAGVAVSGVR
jgi:long-chain acyl-CoA synthetase